jgi:hypothetical protein
MPGVPRELVELHRLENARFDKPKRKAITSELHRLENAGFIREIKSST